MTNIWSIDSFFGKDSSVSKAKFDSLAHHLSVCVTWCSVKLDCGKMADVGWTQKDEDRLPKADTNNFDLLIY